eukprot:GILK01010146.1.p1 GENE.GILK01010146.1~~GILK01010146.1.p1  ORF type:complete len:309 (-),score=47.01 GILK01010146.1:28-954(-)
MEDQALQRFLQIRDFVSLMHEGASLLKWELDSLQMRWFWVNSNNTFLLFKMEDDTDGEEVTRVFIEDIVEILPGQRLGHDTTSVREDRSFCMILRDRQVIEIVCPSAYDYEVWFQGLHFLAGLPLPAGNAPLSPRNGSPVSDTNRYRHGHSCRSQSFGSRSSFQSRPAPSTLVRITSSSSEHLPGSQVKSQRGTRLSKPTPMRCNGSCKAEELNRVIREQRQALHRLEQEKQDLIALLQKCRAECGEGRVHRKTWHTSLESDLHLRERENPYLKERLAKYKEILTVKEATVQRLLRVLHQCLRIGGSQ